MHLSQFYALDWTSSAYSGRDTPEPPGWAEEAVVTIPSRPTSHPFPAANVWCVISQPTTSSSIITAKSSARYVMEIANTRRSSVVRAIRLERAIVATK